MERLINLEEKESYISPDIEIVEIELEQSFFAGSGNVPDMGGEDW